MNQRQRNILQLGPYVQLKGAVGLGSQPQPCMDSCLEGLDHRASRAPARHSMYKRSCARVSGLEPPWQAPGLLQLLPGLARALLGENASKIPPKTLVRRRAAERRWPWRHPTQPATSQASRLAERLAAPQGFSRGTTTTHSGAALSWCRSCACALEAPRYKYKSVSETECC